MNYREILAQSIRHVNYRNLFTVVSGNQDDFFIVFELMFDENEKVAWRAGWVCEKASEKSPDFFSEREIERIIRLVISTNFTGLQRLSLSILLNLGLPKEVPVEFLNISFERMISPKSPVAVQVLSMKILYEFTRFEPDFKAELKAYLESVNIDNYTAGYRAARKNTLKKLQKGEV